MISFETWSHLGSSFGYDTNCTDNDNAHTDDNHCGNGWHNDIQVQPFWQTRKTRFGNFVVFFSGTKCSTNFFYKIKYEKVELPGFINWPCLDLKTQMKTMALTMTTTAATTGRTRLTLVKKYCKAFMNCSLLSLFVSSPGISRAGAIVPKNENQNHWSLYR